MKSLEVKFLIAPIIILIVVIVSLHIFNFKYIDQIIIVSGPIMAALISMYVVKSKDSEATETIQKDRDTRLEYVFSLIEAGLRSLNEEAKNYNKFVDKIREVGMAEVVFSFSSFHLIEQSLDYNQGDFYTSLVSKYPSNVTEAKQKYIRLTNDTQTALLLQENAKNEYEKFITSYNRQAGIFKNGMLALNKIYGNLTVQPSGNLDFDTAFFKIIKEYNQQIYSGSISPYSFSDVREWIIKPIAKLLHSGFVPREAFYELQRVFKELEVSLNKMEEVQNITTSHIEYIRDHMVDLANRIKSTLEFFGVEITDAAYLELKPINDDVIPEARKGKRKVELRK